MNLPALPISTEQLLESIPEPFLVIDRDFTVVAANGRFLESYGYTCSSQVVGRACHEVGRCLGRSNCPLESVFSHGIPVTTAGENLDGDGSRRRFRLHAVPIREGGEVRFVGEYAAGLRRVPGQAMVAGAESMRRTMGLLERVADTRATVLLLGESGVGKECAARYVHQHSRRADAPFVVVDCGALGENLIESELFGHEKGSFTGAAGTRAGLFEVADGGTLFIDEVGELPLALQAKLLRVLETGEIRRVGGNRLQRVDVRVVAATNRDPGEMVAQGHFREDLYYRLAAFPVRIPPLRERPEDLPSLAEHFLQRVASPGQAPRLSAGGLSMLRRYDFPGNVRELRNIMERAAIMAGGTDVGAEHIVLEGPRRPFAGGTENAPQADAASRSASRLLDRRHGRLSEEQVLEALARNGGHRARTAQELGVSERTLYRYVNRLREGSTETAG